MKRSFYSFQGCCYINFTPGDSPVEALKKTAHDYIQELINLARRLKSKVGKNSKE